MRRMMAVMLSVLMVLMTAVPAFAEDGGLTTILDFFGEVTPESIAAGPNLIVLAHCSNPDCLVFPEAGDLTVVISHEGMEDILPAAAKHPVYFLHEYGPKPLSAHMYAVVHGLPDSLCKARLFGKKPLYYGICLFCSFCDNVLYQIFSPVAFASARSLRLVL